jgi:hypothetical protein
MWAKPTDFLVMKSRNIDEITLLRLGYAKWTFILILFSALSHLFTLMKQAAML